MKRQQRSAYTLLEVVVAMSIGLLLLASLYSAFSMLVKQTQTSRQIINDANISRSIFLKITDDISGQLAPLDTRLVRLPDSFFEKAQAKDTETTSDAQTTESTNSSNQSTNSANQSSSTNNSSNQSSNTNNSSNQSSSANNSSNQSSSSSTEEEEAENNDYACFNFGVIGNAQQLNLYIGKVPDFRTLTKNPDTPVQHFSDLKRISYWLAQGPDGTFGLARQEVKIATSLELLQGMAVQGPDQQQFIIADKVVNVAFEYFDGSTWLQEWNGGQLAADGKTPYGPPMAIAINLEVQRGKVGPDGQMMTKSYRHVVSIPAANGISTQLPDSEQP